MDGEERTYWAAIATFVGIPVAAAIFVFIQAAVDDSPPEVCERDDYSPGCLEYEPDRVTGG